MRKLFIFVILLLVVGISSMAASFYCGPRYIDEEFHHYNSGICNTAYNDNENCYPTNNYNYDNYYNGRRGGCCHSNCRW